METIENKVVSVSGARRGIGAAGARAFAAAGARVVLAARDEAALNEVAKEIGGALVVPTDVSDSDSVRALVERTLQEFGRLDAAFNNAGANYALRPVAEIPEEEFDKTLAVNLRGIFLSMKYEIKAMLASGGGGIVHIAATAARGSPPRPAPHLPAKHGLAALPQAP